MKLVPSTIALLFVMFLGTMSHAQTPQQWERRADQSLKKKDFYGAAFYLKKAIVQDSSDLERFFKYAEALRNYNNYNEAAAAYSELFYRDDDEQYPLALFYWALMTKQTGDYKEAQNRFEQFTRIYKERDDYLERAKLEIKACQWSEKQTAADSVEVTNIGEGINTFDSEFAPTRFNDTLMYFTSLRFDSNASRVTEQKDAELITFRASKSNGWTTLDSLTNFLMYAKETRTNLAFDSTRNTMYYSVCQERCQIFKSESNGVTWEPGESIGRAVNFPGWNATHPAVAYSKGKTYLLFASDRDRGGQGGYDLWQIELRKNGRLGRAKSLRSVNTPGNEITPYFDSKNQRLYFSSNYHKGFGGYDVFKSSGKITDLHKPENALLPINSPANDLYFSTYQDTAALLVSNREGSLAIKDETCCNDIYFAEIKPRELDTIPKQVVPDTTAELTLAPKEVVSDLLPVTVFFDNDQPNPRTKQTTTDANYQELVNNYLNRKSEFEKQLEGREKQEIGVFFDFNVEDGWERLQNFADSLHSTLEKGAKVHIGIRGYASPLAQSDYNDFLSQRRVQSVLNYLWKTHNGKLEKFYREGSLVIHKLPFGERLSATSVSDELENQKASVYSVTASLERKVRLGVIRAYPKNEPTSVLIFEREWVDFEEMPLGEMKTHRFEFTNAGDDTLKIEAVIPACGCTAADFSKEPILPGEKGFITVNFTAKGITGVQVRKVRVIPKGDQKPYILFIRAEVME